MRSVSIMTIARDIKSVGHGMTWAQSMGADDIGIALTELTDKVSTRLQGMINGAHGVKIEITTPEFKGFRDKSTSSLIIALAAFRKCRSRVN